MTTRNAETKPAAAPAPKPEMQRELTFTRVFDAPRALVFAAWTDPRHVAQWWGPNGFTAPRCEVDARVGGEIRILMRSPDGHEFPMRGVFREVVAPERLVFTNSPIDEHGKPVIDGLTTVTFAESGGRTTMTVKTWARVLDPASAWMLQGMEQGWSETLDRVVAHVTRAGGQ